MTTYVSGTMIVADGIKKIKTRLEPGGPAVRDLYGLVQDMIGRQDLIFRGSCPVEGIIAVQLDHGAAFLNGRRGIDLDFVILLRLQPG